MTDMRRPKIDKVTINISLGEGGQKLLNAEDIITKITGQKPVRTIAKKTRPTFEIKKGEPVGCKVTLRKDVAKKFLQSALAIKDNKLDKTQFDKNGNFSFGIEEHTDFPNMQYDPEVGIFGMDVTVVLKRPGHRVEERKIGLRKIPRCHRLSKEDAIVFLKEEFGVEVV